MIEAFLAIWFFTLVYILTKASISKYQEWREFQEIKRNSKRYGR